MSERYVGTPDIETRERNKDGVLGYLDIDKGHTKAEFASKRGSAGGGKKKEIKKARDVEEEKLDKFYKFDESSKKCRLIDEMKLGLGREKSRDVIKNSLWKEHRIMIQKSLSSDILDDLLMMMDDPDYVNKNMSDSLKEKLLILKKCGVDVSRLIRVNGFKIDLKDEKLSSSEQHLLSELNESKRRFTDYPNRLAYLSNLVSNFKQQHYGLEIPEEFIKEMDKMRLAIQLGDYIGEIKEASRGADSYHTLINAPLPGGRYVAQFENRWSRGGQPLSYERVALHENRYLNVSKLKDWFFTQWRENMSGLFGESGVENPNEVGRKISTGSADLKEISDGIAAALKDYQDGTKSIEEAFPSLIEYPGDPLKIKKLRNHFNKKRSIDLNDLKLGEIPELKIKAEIDKLRDYQEALSGEMTLLASLKTTGKDIDEMAKMTTAYSPKNLAILWSAGEVIVGTDPLTKIELKPIESYQDEIMRWHWIIARVSDLKPGEEIPAGDRDKIPLELEKFIRGYLTVRDQKIEDGKLKDEEFVLNRWANASAGHLKKFDNFVSLATRLGIREMMIGGKRDKKKLADFKRNYDELNSSDVSVAVTMGAKRSPAEVAIEIATIRGYADELSLGFAEQMGGYVVKRGIKQKDGGIWDKSDIEKAIKKGDLYTRSGSRVITVPGDMEYENLVIYERKVAGYPISTDMTKLTRVATKLEGEIDEGTSYGSAGLSVAIQKKFIPEMWIGNMFQTTKITELGAPGEKDVVRSLWNLWWDEEKSLKELSSYMRHDSGNTKVVTAAPEDAVTKWQKNRNITYKMWKLMKSEDPKDLQSFFNDDLIEMMSAAAKYGLLLPDLSPELRKDALSRVRGAVIGAYYVMHYGFADQQRGSALMKTKGEAATVGSSLQKDRTTIIYDILRDDKRLDLLGKRVFKSILKAFGADGIQGIISVPFGRDWRGDWDKIISI